MAMQLPELPLPPVWRSCHLWGGRAKKRYPSRQAAEHDAARIEEEQCIPMHAYRCPSCGAFHVGREGRGVREA